MAEGAANVRSDAEKDEACRDGLRCCFFPHRVCVKPFVKKTEGLKNKMSPHSRLCHRREGTGHAVRSSV